MSPARRQAPTGHQVPPTPGVTGNPPPAQPPTNVGVDRGLIIASGLRSVAAWSWRFLVIVVALGVLMWLLAQVWVGVFPIIMAIIVSTVLWPAVRFLTRHRWPAALASGVVLLLAFLIAGGTIAAIAPSIASQSQEVVQQAGQGVDEVRRRLAGPPINLDNEQIGRAIDQSSTWLQDRGSQIASGVFTGVAAVGSGLVSTALILVLTFFFLKDGPAFLPWMRSVSGRSAGRHLTELSARVWRTVSGFIRTQALVGLIDAMLIGTGLLILQVPLAFALMVLTFIAAFIPVVGAIIAGGLAVLVALVSNGLTTAIWVVVIVLAVQQIEGNVLLPVLQSKTMDLHPGIVLIAIAAGSTLFGIVGAFLAVPLAASLVVMMRYLSEQIDLRAGDLTAEDVRVASPQGALVVSAAERQAGEWKDRVRTRRHVDQARDARERTVDPPSWFTGIRRRLRGRKRSRADE